MTILKHQTESNKAFSTVAALIRMNTNSPIDLHAMIINWDRSYRKRSTFKKHLVKNKNPIFQTSLFFEVGCFFLIKNQKTHKVNQLITNKKNKFPILVG